MERNKHAEALASMLAEMDECATCRADLTERALVVAESHFVDMSAYVGYCDERCRDNYDGGER